MRLAVYARSFCRHAGLGAALLSTLTNLVSPPVAAANQHRSHQARTPVKHVIVIIGENRTFDHVYATYKPRHGQLCDPVTEDPKAGSTEIWSFANTTGDAHPIHTHLVRFQVLNRQPFDVMQYLQNNKLVFTGNPMPPERNERPAWKDTVKTYPGYLTRVIQKFDLPAGTPVSPGQEFRYVWHCHVLEHEDNEMMRSYNVIG
jgi:spore coat protein A